MPLKVNELMRKSLCAAARMRLLPICPFFAA
nr:MAG TPA: hypothetical protein [Caudoviricetes sp.]